MNISKLFALILSIGLFGKAYSAVDWLSIKSQADKLLQQQVPESAVKPVCLKAVCPIGRLWAYAPKEIKDSVGPLCADICQEGHPKAAAALKGE